MVYGRRRVGKTELAVHFMMGKPGIFFLAGCWIEYFNGTTPGENVREVIENSWEKVIVSTINIAEIYKAFLRDLPYPDNGRLAEASRAAIIQRQRTQLTQNELSVLLFQVRYIGWDISPIKLRSQGYIVY